MELELVAMSLYDLTENVVVDYGDSLHSISCLIPGLGPILTG
jgi:hypothetical protein